MTPQLVTTEQSTAVRTNLLQCFQEPPPEEEPPQEELKEEVEGKEEAADGKKKLELPKPKPPAGMIGKPGDDLTLRAAMYGVLFQSYADQVSVLFLKITKAHAFFTL